MSLGNQHSKAFTLIELVIVVSIIVIMAVLAIPAFDRYGARNELDGKAEEVKTFIETAYKQAQSPQKGANGSIITIDNMMTVPTFVSSQMSYDQACLTGVDFPSCGTIVSSNSVPIPTYFHLLYLNPAGDSLKLGFKTPVSADLDNCFNSCDSTILAASFQLTSDHVSGETRTITINRNPFKVTVTSP